MTESTTPPHPDVALPLIRLFEGDSLDVLATIPDGTYTGFVTDPPYGLSAPPDALDVIVQWALTGDFVRGKGGRTKPPPPGLSEIAARFARTAGPGGFLGAKWDSFVPGPRLWREVFRTCKPGAIGADLHDLEPAGHLGLQVATQFAEAHPPVGDVESGAQRCQVGAMRGAEHPLIRPLVRTGVEAGVTLFEQPEDTAAVVVGDDDPQIGRTWFAGPDEQAGRVVHKRQIAHERDERIKRLSGKIDRVLVDAPCSGLGTLRRNPDLKWRQSPQALEELVAKQTAILESAARLPKSGGRLVYATCSMLPQENEAIAEAFTQAHRDFEPLDAGELLAQLKVPEAASLCSGGESGSRFVRLWPHRHQTDGFFAAVWQRK